MLSYLHVKNLALIDELEVEFGKGLNIITGETGVGKSIIVGSVNLALGGKASKDFIKKDCKFALVELIFLDPTNEINAFLDENGFETSNQISVSRKLSQNSRSIYKINGEVANAHLVSKLSSILIDIHSQKEHQSILIKKNHIKLLDKFLGDEITSLLKNLAKKTREYHTLFSELNEDPLDDQQRLREISFLEHEINEIESATLSIGEDIALEKQYKRLSNRHKTVKILGQVEMCINGDDDISGASWLIADAIKSMSSLKDMDQSLENLSDVLEQIDFLIGDFSRDLSTYVEGLYIDEEELEEITNRMDLINHLKSKYGNSLEDILNQLEEKQGKLDGFIHYEDRMKSIKKKIKTIEDEILALCEALSVKRQHAAKMISDMITAGLKSLNFKTADFQVMISKKNSFTENGYDDVEFFVSMNEGEALKPMNLVASGGEISRIMLAIKTVFADYDDIDTLVFDEIDRGISGRTAQKVAEKMANLSNNRQIICITHLPQIAAMADTHFVVNKDNRNENAMITMDLLNNAEVSNELARLIGGVTITESILSSAIEMKELANQFKKSSF
jgi:DNA repair protein RecN (Recombination protein N)